jgi:hypothetical protein
MDRPTGIEPVTFGLQMRSDSFLNLTAGHTPGEMGVSETAGEHRRAERSYVLATFALHTRSGRLV